LAFVSDVKIGEDTPANVHVVKSLLYRHWDEWRENVRHHIFVVRVAGGNAKKLTTNPAADVQPVFSRDGKYMFVRAQRRPQFESDRWYIDIYDRASGAKRTLFESPDLSVNDFKVAPDGSAVAFIATSKGEDNLFRVPLDGGGASGPPEPLTKGGSVNAFDFGPDFAMFARSSLTAPAEIFRVTRETMNSPKPLTRENESWLKDVTFEKPE